MEYRKLPKGNKQISVIGFGGSGLHQAGEKEAVETINLALENGINYFDLAVSFCWGQALDASPHPSGWFLPQFHRRNPLPYSPCPLHKK